MCKKRNLFFFVFPLLAVLVLLTSCPNNEKFGGDADYFAGLQQLNENNLKEAKQKFNSCIKKGTYYCAKESAIQLTKMGNLQEKMEAAKFLYERFPDPDSLLILAQQYLQANELRKLLEITENLDYATADNALIKIRLDTLNTMNQTERFKEEAYKWFVSRAITQEHYQYYRDVYAPLYIPEDTAYDSDSDYEDDDDEEIFYEQPEPTVKDLAIQYRITLYRRNYLLGYFFAEDMIEYFKNGQLEPAAMLASDIGKAYLYGSEQIVQDAVYLRKQAEELKGTEAEFYFWFYAARLYDGANLYYSQASTCYENAIAATEDPSKKDNALWYLMKTKLKLSLDKTLASIGLYAQTWSDPEYFDDFFDALIPSLIVNGKWSAFKPLLDSIDGYATKEITAQISYLYARLIEEGFIDIPEEQRVEAARQAYIKALDSGTQVYYKVLAAYRLGYTGSVLDKALGIQPETKAQPEDTIQSETTPADNLLNGYAYFGYPDKIYSVWQDLNQQGISPSTGFYLAEFLNKCAAEDDDYYVQALRIAARAGNMSTQLLTKQNLMCVYPQNYSKLVDTYAKKYDINTSVIYALIRSESFFDKEIVSSAGAVGLTQLMGPTAGEIAQKLKLKEYELTDPETNIMFGIYYLSELIRRGDGSLLRAFFSYNAGFRKVTTWLNSSMLEFGKDGGLAMDLFLETVPVSETREYGRKLVGATVMYEYLYGNTGFPQVVESLLK